MHEIVNFLAKHGYWLIFVFVIARQACLPVPGNLVLLAAGALSGAGRLNFAGIVILSVCAFLLADLAWFQAGRWRGTRILHFACGLSGDPSACVDNAHRTFARNGVRSLLISKFVIGLDAVAAPLAGASGVTRLQFVVFDITGAILWSCAYATLGYVFSEQLDLVASYAGKAGTIIAILFLIGIGIYIVRKIVLWCRFMHEFNLARITPDELQEKLKAGESILILDVQQTGSRALDIAIIPGALRIDPRNLGEYKQEFWEMQISAKREVVLYCTCPGEYTSARLARVLERRGLMRVRPLAGGLQAWRDRGFPVTPDVVAPLGTPSPLKQSS
jgi:membrane protein DedA with SNARE-associated domain/rhodanese-related sulfurtransferase